MKNEVFTNTIKKSKTMSKKAILLAATLFTGLVSFAEENRLNAPSNTVTATEETTTVAEETYYYERRFSSITEAGTSFMRNQPYFNIYQVLGVRVNPYFFIGQGFGLQVSGNKQLQLQATADLRAYVLDKKVTPMFTVQAGLNKVSNSPVDEKRKLSDTQFILNSGTGILIKARENASFTINGGYTLYTDFKNRLNGGFVKVGYVF